MIELFQRYVATIRLRRERDGEPWPVKPEVEQLDGRRMAFKAAWQVEDDDDRYPGEWAMTPDPIDVWFPTGWVASGDLADVTPWQPPAEETVQGREVDHD